MRKTILIGLIGICLITSLVAGCAPAAEEEVEAPVLVSISVTPASAEIEVDKTKQYQAVATYSDGNTRVVTTEATWSNSETAVATVSPEGLASAKAAGSTTITAALEGKNGSATLTVSTLSVTVVDSIGRTVTLDMPIERIVVTEDKIGEVLRILGAEDLVVGIDPNMTELGGMFPVMGDKPQVGNCASGELDYELIAELDPDVVLISNYAAAGETIEPLERIGTKVIAVENFFGSGVTKEGEEILDGKDIDLTDNNFVHCFSTLGKILDREERAQEFLDWMTDKLEAIMERTDDLEEDEVLDAFLGMSSTSSGLRIAGNGRKEDTTMDMTGLHNIMEVYGTFDVDPEYLLSHSPDIIFLFSYGSATGGYTMTDPQSLEEIIETVSERPELEESPAVRDGRVYVISGECLDIRPWIGAAYMGKWAYPERFEDIDPNEIAREYFEDWVRVSYEGIHFWPSP